MLVMNRYTHPEAKHRTARRTLIACEGSVTEPGYFQAIRRHLHLPERAVTLLKDLGPSPKALVRGALKCRDRLMADDAFHPSAGDTLWAVFDGDEHRQSDPHSWNETLKLAEREGVRLAISNPSFELWYLLHFEMVWAPLDNRAAIDRLRKHLPRYTKADALFPQPLLPLTHTALERADRLAGRARELGQVWPANPSSGVSTLVRHLFELG
jgi:hypothetical protein